VVMVNLRRHRLPCFWSVACPLTGAGKSYWHSITMTPGRVAAHGIHHEGHLAPSQSAARQDHEPWLPVRCVAPSLVPIEDS
jgi:hypothetical protein